MLLLALALGSVRAQGELKIITMVPEVIPEWESKFMLVVRLGAK